MWPKSQRIQSDYKRKRGSLWFFLFLFFVAALFLFLNPKEISQSDPAEFFPILPEATSTRAEPEPGELVPVPEKEPKPLKAEIKLIDNDISFVAQAPFGDWKDQRQQDGCEEASALMAVAWAKKENLTAEKALLEIKAISDYLLSEYGEYRDVNVKDVAAWIFRDYLDFDQVTVKTDVRVADLIAALQADKIILAPMDGRKLSNPYFTPPGPERHMLLIRGYDPEKKEFITNDPGTRRGQAYRYHEEVLHAAILSYPTGYHEAVEGSPKDVIIVSR
jgi:hypothetical protein